MLLIYQRQQLISPVLLAMGLSSKFFPSLADLVLKDKIVVYDLANQRIGWADYDCEFTI